MYRYNMSQLILDYPRVCGGTKYLEDFVVFLPGLSPRVRGNQQWRRSGAHVVRTIPACAGEPLNQTGRSRGRPYYPRVCGGTTSSPSLTLGPCGLSPRVRGNHKQPFSHSGPVRTIPACAGEPIIKHPHHSPDRDYPRVCGGTNDPSAPITYQIGLSPRVRGNHCVQRGQAPS